MALTSNQDFPSASPVSNDNAEVVVPLYTEEASVSKRQIETGRVRVSTATKQHEQLIEEVLASGKAQIERRSVERQIDSIPAVREDGDTIIVPVVEEVLVIERRLMLVFE